jgi:hypothetical protein
MSGSDIFNKKINNTGHDLMFHEYPQEFTDSIVKPPRNNCPSSGTIYRCDHYSMSRASTSEKFKHTGDPFNVITIFKTKQALNGTLMKTGPV